MAAEEIKYMGTEAAEQIANNVKAKFAETVRVNAQTLSEAQQAQARENIGVASITEADIDSALETDDEGTIIQKGAVSYDPQELTEEQKAQARENIGAVCRNDMTNQNQHAKYFDITEDGVLSLKAEYRGATTYPSLASSISDNGAGVNGSANQMLPSILFIPETVNGIVVTSIADGAFINNLAFVDVVLPCTIDSLPNRCFYGCFSLEYIYNTENITSIGVRCFNECASLKIAKFPNLTEVLSESNGAWTFARSLSLVFADIGKLTTIPARMFYGNVNLQRVRSRGAITSVGDAAFFKDVRLQNIGDMSELTTIGSMAFVGPNMKDVDWYTFTGDGISAYATPAKINPTDIWSECTYTPCENPLPTYLSQKNPEWTNLTIGSSSIKYGSGCNLMVLIHAYCGLHNIKLNNPQEFEEIANSIKPGVLDSYTTNKSSFQSIATDIGLQWQHYGEWTAASLQAVYDALADGKYVAIRIGNGGPQPVGHMVLVYGVTSDGQFMIVDSENLNFLDHTIPFTYTVFYKNYCYYKPEHTPYILSLSDDV